tara:strand:- start:29 stop:970 length:942 start_codon:yes stop_codon:yes gene_type:complete
LSISEKIKILTGVLGSSHNEGHSQLLYHCPKCSHHKKKLSINIEKNLFKCWICDWSGRNIYRVIKYYGNHHDRQAWLRLTQQIEIGNFADKLFGPIDPEEEPTVSLPAGFVSLVNKSLPASSSKPLNYLDSRYIDRSDIFKWKIGYCSEGEYSGRIIVPSFNLDGNINYFIGRSYDGSWFRYKNPSLSKNFIFNELYLDFSKEITIVEGVFDAFKAGSNAVPLLGSTLTEYSKLFSKIVQNDTTVYLSLDNDAPKKIDKIIRLFFKYDIEAYLVDPSPYEDIGAMTKDQFFVKKQESILLESNNYLLSRIMRI